MNIPEEPGENCINTIHDLIENKLNINTEHMQLQAAHRVGKARSNDVDKASPRPVIVRFLLRDDREKVLKAKNKLKSSENYKDVYIMQDYMRASRWRGKLSSKPCSRPRKKV